MYSLKSTICFKLMMIRDRIQEVSKREFQKIGITYGNYVTMLLIYENPGITQAALAELNHKERSVTGQTVDKLEKKGYVRRVRDRNDRRAYTLYLSETGNHVIKKYWGLTLEGERHVLESLTKEEQEAFQKLLEKLTEGADPYVK